MNALDAAIKRLSEFTSAEELAATLICCGIKGGPYPPSINCPIARATGLRVGTWGEEVTIHDEDDVDEDNYCVVPLAASEFVQRYDKGEWADSLGRCLPLTWKV